MIKENVKSITLYDMVGPNFDFKCPEKIKVRSSKHFEGIIMHYGIIVVMEFKSSPTLQNPSFRFFLFLYFIILFHLVNP